MSTPNTSTTGVVLSGGASYAAYEVGVVRALLAGDSPATNYEPLSPDIIVGTSAGAVNAAILVAELEKGSGHAAKYLDFVWRQHLADRPESCGTGAYRLRGDLTRLLDPACLVPNPAKPFLEASGDLLYFARDSVNRAMQFFSSREPPARRIVELVNLHTAFSLEPFKSVLQAVVNADAVMSSRVKLGVTTTNWSTGEAEVYSNHDMTAESWLSIMMASASVPGLPPVDVSGQPHADGAYVSNTPIIPAIEYGANSLHVVYMDPDPRKIPVASLKSTIGLIDKVYLLLVAAMFNRDIDIVRDVNIGLQILGSHTKPKFADTESKLSFVRSIAWMQSAAEANLNLRPITLHRYRPAENLGGVLGKMNFDYNNISQLIDLGYRDAVAHDCGKNGCLRPLCQHPKTQTVSAECLG